jgi:S1-C subfamily serine protease
MFPRTLPQSSVEIEALGINDGLDWQKCDWLILKLKHPAEALPAQPLHVRPDPVAIGERLYLIGCPYIERDCKQNVYRGKVTARGFSDHFRYDLDPPVELPGFSGAPIVDEKGYLVGVMTVWFQPKMDGKKYLEGGGEDAATIYSNIEGQ